MVGSDFDDVLVVLDSDVDFGIGLIETILGLDFGVSLQIELWSWMWKLSLDMSLLLMCPNENGGRCAMDGKLIIDKKLHDMRKRARDIFWWPFTQHEIVPIENITVIDSRCGEKFAVHKAGSYDLITQQFDACASWWTHGT
ncbi:hypothetical protein ACH5RR_033797 [Cinchona calisaya]|uniref:Uncharacterized protein n=1 Tax=Cinchona calisaya TaxID=153742 RepID=A0ABD2YAA8_9GENT